MSARESQGNTDDWESRVLCSDGNCIGVIGPDGLCKECGRPQAVEKTGSETPQVAPPVDSPESADRFSGVPEKDDWENRVLCGDGNCIGVIGQDGLCRECGKPLRKEAEAE